MNNYPCGGASTYQRLQKLTENSSLFRTNFSQCQAGKTTAIWRTSVWEAGVSRHHGSPFSGSLKALRTSQHYMCLRGTLNWSTTMPKCGLFQTCFSVFFYIHIFFFLYMFIYIFFICYQDETRRRISLTLPNI